MASIVVEYTAQHGGNTVYSVTMTRFSGEDLPRSYGANASFDRSANGASILAGPGYKEKRIWAFSTFLTGPQTAELYNMFEAWDEDRANGLPVACSIVDDTLVTTVSTSVLFSTPPTFTRLGYSGEYIVDFGMSEV